MTVESTVEWDTGHRTRMYMDVRGRRERCDFLLGVKS